MAAPSPPLALFHTADSNRALFAGLLDRLAPGTAAVHAVGADLLARAAAAGALTDDLRRDAARRMAEVARDAGARVLLCTCSTLGPAAEEAGFLRVDRPMAERALDLADAGGGRVAVAACLASTLAPTLDLLAAVARERDSTAVLTTHLLADAWAHFEAGDLPAYWNAVATGVRGIAAGADAVVLAQASMAGAADLCRDLAAPVLASPELGLAAALAALDTPS
ncbi:MAG: hypothetical protein H6907_05245 [Hyphomicrobiales bacterium]|nr:hypothetical protein [Hyphomicrobiales bacterium]MCP5371121.1 hypothetical protein [Hyphomicrobiales bacterium]